MKSIFSSAAALGILSLLTSACGIDRTSTVLGPTSTTNASSSTGGSTAASGGPLVGTWASSAVAAPTSLTSCGNFQYIVTTQTATTIAGTFTGACGGGVAITGSATGQISGTNVAIVVTGNANVPGNSACPISLSGNGTIEDNGNTLRIPFTGTTCLGPVTGTEVLRKPQAAVEAAVIDAPAAVAPSPNQILTGIRTRFTVANSSHSGPVGSLVYEFEVANDEAFTSRFGDWNLHEATSQTSLDLPIDLAYSSVYYWHVRAFDGNTTGPWSRTLAFATPNPPPPPLVTSSDPTFGCSTADKYQLVACIRDHLNPPGTVEGAFDVTRRVAWALRGEGAGLLIKPGGENITTWAGYSFAAGRICYPDGHIYKVLSDVPTTNGPSWQDNGFVDPSLYVPAINPNR